MLSFGLVLAVMIPMASVSAHPVHAGLNAHSQDKNDQERVDQDAVDEDSVIRDGGQNQSLKVSPQIQAMELIRERMEQVKKRFAEANTSSSTQALQLEVLGQLDQLITDDMAAQQQASASQQNEDRSDGGAQQTESQQSPNDAFGQGTGQQGTTAESLENPSGVVDRAWGHLRDRVRVRMRSALSEQFLPKYEKLIEAYYKRLASADEDGQ